MTLDQIIQRLEDVKFYPPQSPKISRAYRSKCPSCGGGKDKFNISSLLDGKILVHCHGGCSINEVTSAIGIDISDLYQNTPNNSPGKYEKPITVKGWEWRSLASSLQELHGKLSNIAIGITENLPIDDTCRLKFFEAVKLIKEQAEQYKYGKGSR